MTFFSERHDAWQPLTPQWPSMPGVRALCTTRHGGVSQPPFDTLNLGDHVGDTPAAVAANRGRLQAQLQAITPGARAVFLRQVHGSKVASIGSAEPDGMEADACLTSEAGVVCTIMVADCLPVLFSHRTARMVGAAHAGWRGLAGVSGVGVLEAFFDCFWAQSLTGKAREAIKNIVENASPGAPSGSAASIASTTEVDAGAARAAFAADTLAWLGPCIGPRAFEVGAEVVEAFSASHPAARSCFSPQGGGKYLAHLPALARLRLKALGIHNIYGNDGSSEWCTVLNASQYFSHRRDAASLGSSGRFAACIWLDP